MVVVRAHRFSRVEIIFGKRESARSDRGPRIHKAEQDDVELSIRARNEVTAFAQDRLDIRAIVEIARSRAITSHELKHEWIHLDGSYFLAARSKGRYHVRPTAGSDDQR